MPRGAIEHTVARRARGCDCRHARRRRSASRVVEAAGSREVVDLHGRLDRVVCLSCGATSSRGELRERLDEFVKLIDELQPNPRLRRSR